MAVINRSADLLFNGQLLQSVSVVIDEARRECRGPVGPVGGRDIVLTGTVEGGRSWFRIFDQIWPSKPRWGQPGRHRRRQARVKARRMNESGQKLRAWLDRKLPSLSRLQAQSMTAKEIRLAVVLTDPPKGKIFTWG